MAPGISSYILHFLSHTSLATFCHSTNFFKCSVLEHAGAITSGHNFGDSRGGTKASHGYHPVQVFGSDSHYPHRWSLSHLSHLSPKTVATEPHGPHGVQEYHRSKLYFEHCESEWSECRSSCKLRGNTLSSKTWKWSVKCWDPSHARAAML